MKFLSEDQYENRTIQILVNNMAKWANKLLNILITTCIEFKMLSVFIIHPFFQLNKS